MGKTLDVIVLLLYPLVVFLGLTYIGIRWTALFLLILAGRRFIASLLKSRETSRLMLIQAALMTIIIGAAAAFKSEHALKVTPFLVSLTFIAMFASSLKTTPLIERFARLKKKDLSDEEKVYCRKLTKIWVLVLGCNSVILLIASMLESKVLWTVLVGPVSYGLIGCFFSLEYIYRKRLFQEFDNTLLDRLLRAVLERKQK